MTPLPPKFTLFPYTTLFRSHSPHLLKVTLSRNNYDGKTPNYISVVAIGNEDKHTAGSITISSHFTDQKTVTIHLLKKNGQDRKSTRLNSSHANISYAVFCLK